MSNQLLLVDDDHEFREEFKECMIEYDIIEAKDGKEALRILKSPNEISLVILDVKMPGMSGIEVLNKIRSLNESVGVIILTAYSSKDTIVEALRNKADDFLEKPIQIEDTKRVIEKVLNSLNGLASSEKFSKIDRTKRFIERNILKKITLKDAAKAVHLNPKYLSRLFIESTGQNFNDFKLTAKIEKAKDMLINSNLSINMISERLGYMNAESFIRMFKKLTNTTPNGYRKEHGKNK